MFNFPKNPFEKAHEKYHKRRRDTRSDDRLDRFHDHYLTEDDHKDAEHTEKCHKFHTGHRLALVGNPNCGKTTLFNYLTGSSQYVGNWPGVTVEKKEGKSRMGGENITIVDLPGIYSLSPYTSEEIIARNYIIDQTPELIINIVDATNLERNLYLTTQLLELGRPMIVALNMVDMLRRRGDKIDIKALRNRLGVPVIPISASKGEGVMELMHKAHKYAEEQILPTPEDIYEGPLLDTIANISTVITRLCEKRKNPVRWSAVKLFEGDSLTKSVLRPDESLLTLVEEQSRNVGCDDPGTPQFTNKYMDRDMIVADSRYKWICSVCRDVCTKKHTPDKLTVSDIIDAAVTNRFAAIPIFLIMMGLVFWLTFGPAGAFCQDLMRNFVNIFIEGVRKILTDWGASGWAVGLVCDGALNGVGGVMSFLPQIAILFLCLSILEDSGYMARAAFIMDRPLRKIGLSGKSFVPMLMGFGCTVPAVLATRTLENEKDKRATIMIVPFLSCNAKLPVYAMMTEAFFTSDYPPIFGVLPAGAAAVIFIYALGVILAVLSALLANKTVLRGEAASFVMELPAYRMPTPRGLWIHIWERLRDYISKAGSVILGATIVVWVLINFTPNFQMTSDGSQSIMAEIGRFIAPIFEPAGFGDWKYAAALLTGFIAKEQVYSTMLVIFGADTALNAALRQELSPAAAIAFMAFVLLYTPCVAAVNAIIREMKSAKYSTLTILWGLICAWAVSVVLYHIFK